MKPLILAGVLFGLAGVVSLNAAAEKEQELKADDVPAAVQKAAQNAVKHGKIVRWEKEGENYEAVFQKDNGKQVGVTIAADGKVRGKHDESKEQKEKQ